MSTGCNGSDMGSDLNELNWPGCCHGINGLLNWPGRVGIPVLEDIGAMGLAASLQYTIPSWSTYLHALEIQWLLPIDI